VLVKGDKEAIGELRTSDEFIRILVRVQRVHQSVGVVNAYTGAEMQSLFALWDEPIEGLTP